MKLSNFNTTPIKNKKSAISYDTTQKNFTTHYNHKTITINFTITKKTIKNNLYNSLSTHYTKTLTHTITHTKQIKTIVPLNNKFTNTYQNNNNINLFTTSNNNITNNNNHPLISNNKNSNHPTTTTNLNKTSLKTTIIQINK